MDIKDIYNVLPSPLQYYHILKKSFIISEAFFPLNSLAFVG